MSDSDANPKKGPPVKEMTDSDAPSGTQEKRSRSQSRRSRRRKQQATQSQKKMPPVEESNAETEPDTLTPFEHIGPDSTSMNGPVTHARAQRGEIPKRPGNPKQALATGNPEGAEADGGQVGKAAKKSGESEMMKQDGLKLRLELNLDIELELKAKIVGDITLALL